MCAHDNECTHTHDAIHDVFASIAKEVGLHVAQDNYMFFLPHFKHQNAMLTLPFPCARFEC